MEKYILGQSEEGNIRHSCEEVRLDLELEANPHYEGTLIYGFVENVSTGKPLAGACIICYSPCGFALGQAFSNGCGLYFIPNIRYNQRYYLCVMKPGYSTYYSGFYNTEHKKDQYFELCMRQTRPQSCTICGHVYNACFDNIPNAYVYLTNHCHQVISSTITNQYGQFVFDRVNAGNYNISVEHRCYESYVNQLCVSLETDLIPYRVVLSEYC